MFHYVLRFNQANEPDIEAAALTMRPRSPAARNALRNQISSLVKSMVIRGLWSSRTTGHWNIRAAISVECRLPHQSMRRLGAQRSVLLENRPQRALSDGPKHV